MTSRRWGGALLFLVLFTVACVAAGRRADAPAGAALPPIDHIIVIFLENRSFDHLFGQFPGANGLDRPGARVAQTDLDERPYATLPPVTLGRGPRPTEIDRRFPRDLPNAPFAIDPLVPPEHETPSPVHRFYQHILQINGGGMDRYVAWGGTGALPMGHYQTAKLPLYRLAREFTLADNVFTAAFGGSWLNHMWLICACPPVFPNAPPEMRAEPRFDAAGRLVGLAEDGDKRRARDSCVPDG